jgi:metallophosphoesterase (TIGR00282 family)
MRILYIGDIMGQMGQDTVKQVLPGLIRDQKIDFVIAQGENLSEGKGMVQEDVRAMRQAGVDLFTGGNWSWAKEEIFPLLNNAKEPIIRPANYVEELPGRGYHLAETPHGKILVINLLGQIVGFHQPETTNPLHRVDEILEETKGEKPVAIVVDFHGDFSSEKLVIGQYLDGRATLVVGDHWHIPTADAMVLPGGTAHITDVGMVGSLDSCLGVKTEVITKRWLSDERSKNELETDGRRQFCAVLVETKTTGIGAKSIRQIVDYLPS